MEDAPGLTLGLEESEDVVLTDRALDVPASPHQLGSQLTAARTESRQVGRIAHRTMERVASSMNSTRTWVTPPREPVRPRTLTTLASLTWVFEVDSCVRSNGCAG